jgi:hypothetical protein
VTSKGICNRVEFAHGAQIARSILLLRGHRVLPDADLAALYGVETRRLNEQVCRNRARFPEDFISELTSAEFANLKCILRHQAGRPSQASTGVYRARCHHGRHSSQSRACH